jgi:hypothetical protein
MKLEIATYKATKYAVMNFHYSKTMPPFGCSFSVFNNAGDWCGVILYSKGASNKIAMPYNLVQGQVVELVRVALNGKQESTSKAVSISLNLVKKLNPLVKLIISFADTGQQHIGTIYQATNWYYTGVSKGDTPSYIHKQTGRKYHNRNVSNSGFKDNNTKRCPKVSDCIMVKGTDKHKYIFPADKSMVHLCKRLHKPYPKAIAAAIA